MDSEEFEEHLVPELCNRMDFPSLYWLKATTLPSILHRISRLLVAEKLRVTIASECSIGVVQLPPEQKWKPLFVSCSKESETLNSLHDRNSEDVGETVDVEISDENVIDGKFTLKGIITLR